MSCLSRTTANGTDFLLSYHNLMRLRFIMVFLHQGKSSRGSINRASLYHCVIALVLFLISNVTEAGRPWVSEAQGRDGIQWGHDMLSDGFRESQRVPGWSEASPYNMSFDDQETQVGIVLVHGMGYDFEPDKELDADDPLQALGMVTVEDTGGSLLDPGYRNQCGASVNVMRPANSDAVMDYWGYFPRDVAVLSLDERPRLRPLLVAGYNGIDGWDRATADVARQISLFTYCYQLDKVVVVTHSMGGVVARALMSETVPEPAGAEPVSIYDEDAMFAKRYAASKIARVVTLAAPQGGSYAASAAGILAARDNINVAAFAAPMVSDAVDATGDLVLGDLRKIPIIGAILDVILEAFDALISGIAAVVFFSEELTEWVCRGQTVNDECSLYDNFLRAFVAKLGYDSRSTQMLTTESMSIRNFNLLLGTHGKNLPVEWFSLYGTSPFNQFDNSDDRGYRRRNRKPICEGTFFDIDTYDYIFHMNSIFDWELDWICGESIGLEIVSILGKNIGDAPSIANDGMVWANSAQLVGASVATFSANHHHNRFGDVSKSSRKLDQIGMVRYLAFGDTPEINPVYLRNLSIVSPDQDALEFDLSRVDLSSPHPHTPVMPSIPSIAEADTYQTMMCEKASAFGRGNLLYSYTGMFELKFDQLYTPDVREGYRGSPDSYRIEVHNWRGPELPARTAFIRYDAGRVNDGVNEVTLDMNISQLFAEDRFYEHPVRRRGQDDFVDGAFDEDESTGQDREFEPLGAPVWRGNDDSEGVDESGQNDFVDISGTYTFSVSACNDEGCSGTTSFPQEVVIERGGIVALRAGSVICNPSEPDFLQVRSVLARRSAFSYQRSLTVRFPNPSINNSVSGELDDIVLP